MSNCSRLCFFFEGGRSLGSLGSVGIILKFPKFPKFLNIPSPPLISLLYPSPPFTSLCLSILHFGYYRLKFTPYATFFEVDLFGRKEKK